MPLGAINLLPVSAVLLVLSMVFMARVIRWQRRQAAATAQAAAAIAAGRPAPHADRGVGGGVFAAFGQVARSPYLLGIAAFVLFMTCVSTFLYLEQQAFAARS